MTIMTKRGTQDNIVTYEHICDTTADLSNIDPQYINLGSIAIVLSGDNGLDVYMANSSKEWSPLLTGAGGSGDIDLNDYLLKTDIAAWAKAAQKPSYTAAEVGAATQADIQAAIANINGLSLHICTQQEINNGIPNIASPDANTIYLVPSGETAGNLYEEYIYINNTWEQFGTANINLEGYATENYVDTAMTNTIATTEEVQAIIDKYKEGDDSMLIETEWYEDPVNHYNKGWITSSDIDELAEYIESGKQLIFHCPPASTMVQVNDGTRVVPVSEETQEIVVQESDAYLPLMGFVQNTIDKQMNFSIGGTPSLEIDGSAQFPAINHIYITESNHLLLMPQLSSDSDSTNR